MSTPDRDKMQRVHYTVDRSADHEFSEKRGQQMVVSADDPPRMEPPPPPPPPPPSTESQAE